MSEQDDLATKVSNFFLDRRPPAERAANAEALLEQVWFKLCDLTDTTDNAFAELNAYISELEASLKEAQGGEG